MPARHRYDRLAFPKKKTANGRHAFGSCAPSGEIESAETPIILSSGPIVTRSHLILIINRALRLAVRFALGRFQGRRHRELQPICLAGKFISHRKIRVVTSSRCHGSLGSGRQAQARYTSSPFCAFLFLSCGNHAKAIENLLEI